MSNNGPAQTILTGSDPRNLPEFSAIREEVNKASHPAQPEMNWTLVESLALTLFKNNGVDLQTAAYYTLARTRNHGLSGFCEGVELLAALISHDWDKFWPQNEQARIEMLDWFNSRTGNILRQQLSFSEKDLPLMYRAERALQIICDKLQQVELKRIPRVENLLYFVQNTRKRFEMPPKSSHTGTPVQTTVRTLVYTPENSDIVQGIETEPPLPALPEMKVEVHRESNSTSYSSKKSCSAARGFIAGIACTLMVAAILWWWQVYPLQQQLAQVKDTPQGAATVWLSSPTFSDYGLHLQHLLDQPSLPSLETGEQMTRIADSRWPESLQQQQATSYKALE